MSTFDPHTAPLGKAVPRLDGDAIVSGNGLYNADQIPETAAHVAVLRSTRMRARIVSIDLARARVMPGVLLAIEGRELSSTAQALQPSLGFQGPLAGRGPLQSSCLAVDEVCYVGQPVAAVVATSRHHAFAAIEAISIEYDDRIAVTDTDRALATGSEFAHPGWTTNVVASDHIEWGIGEQAFEGADRVIHGEMFVSPSTSAPMEPLCYVGDWQARQNRLTVTGTFQNPHTSRLLIATALGLSEAQVRVVAPRLGGAFGFKMAGRLEEVLVCALSKILRRPVAYIETRRENLICAASRTQRHQYAIAVSRDGRIVGFSDRYVVDAGIIGAGYGWTMPMVTAAVFPTVYDVPNGLVDARLVTTNKAPWQPIRGYGKEITCLVMEHAIDHAAAELHIDPVEFRQRNLIAAPQLPRRLPSRLNVDSGDYPGALAQLTELFGYSAWRERQRVDSTDDCRVGIGIAIELTPEGGVRAGVYGNSFETATVRITLEGRIEVLTGVTSPGGGSETGIAQLVSGVLRIPATSVRMIQGDTDVTPLGMGNASSKALIYGGMAAYLAAEDLRGKMSMCAANLLSCNVEQLTFADGYVTLAEDPSQRVAFEEIVRAACTRPHLAAKGVELPLAATRTFQPNVEMTPDATGRTATYPSFSYSVHAAAITLDTLTGVVKLLDYAVVHDCGTVVNPMMVESQIRGAIAMGIGAALWEEIKYDSHGVPVSDRFKAYLLPRVPDLPVIKVGHRCTPTPFHPLGMKGAGESGVGGALAALTNAVSDAIRPFGKRVQAVPSTPTRLLHLLHEAQA